jgi:hypothetical protein
MTPATSKFSSDVVLAHENRAEFEELLDAYRVQLKPQNAIEETIAFQAAQALWRLTRVQRLQRVYQDAEILGFSDNPPPDEIIVRNMEQRGKDVQALLSRQEAEINRNWWRLQREIKAILKARDSVLDIEMLLSSANRLPGFATAPP